MCRNACITGEWWSMWESVQSTAPASEQTKAKPPKYIKNVGKNIQKIIDMKPRGPRTKPRRPKSAPWLSTLEETIYYPIAEREGGPQRGLGDGRNTPKEYTAVVRRGSPL